MVLRKKSNPVDPTMTKTLFVVVLGIALAACSQDQTEAPSDTLQEAAMTKAQTERQAEEKAKAAMARLSGEELHKLAGTAFREQRLYAPAGNNALEYYLALRKKRDAPDPMVESALMDLAPYTVIAAEQAITRLDFDEASRLRNLIAEIDPGAPSLPRIGKQISEGMNATRALSAAEIKRKQEALLAAELPTPEKPPALLKSDPANVSIKPATAIAAPVSSQPPTAAATLPTNATPLASRATTASTTMPIPAKRSELVPIRTPDPGFPGDALNRGLSGAVEIEFIVQRNGDVSDVRVVNSSQRAFDRNVVMTVKRWKFAPLEESRIVRRSFNFDNPG